MYVPVTFQSHLPPTPPLVQNTAWYGTGKCLCLPAQFLAQVCRPKKKGGLGIRSLRCMNRSLLAKWHWRFAKERNAWWRSIICEKTNSDFSSLAPAVSKEPIGRSMWSVIAQAKSDFHNCADLQVKDGRMVKFWHDWWLEKRPLATKYPRLFKISLQENANVADMKQGNWQFTFRRRLEQRRA